ncbi:MAG: hypothetical protein RL026_383 [Pseudomonadota bacterium]|jgi:glucose/arabinose dehydrogenase
MNILVRRSTLAITVASLLAACNAPSEAPTAPGTAAGPDGVGLETRPAEGAKYDYRPAFPGQTRAPALQTGTPLEVREVVRGFASPWAFAFLPDGRILVSERAGSLRLVSLEGRLSAPFDGVPAVLFEGQGGLLDIALHPRFEDNNLVYFSYAEPREGGNGTALARARLVESGGTPRLEGVEVLFRQQPTVQSGFHFGSRIVFDGQGHLYLSLGERALPVAREQSQDLAGHLGKVVRLNDDGSVPADNPFVGRAGARPEIWSYGHRNVQAAALDAQGRLWTIEHGPRGGDELNRPEAGRNYGWPVISYGIEYSGMKVGEGATARPGMEQPVYYWDPVIAPSGLVFHSGKLVPEWRGDLFVGGLGSMKLVRLKLDGDRVTGEEWLLRDRNARIRDVQEGPDGALYVITDGPDAALLRIAPAEAPAGV